MPWAKYRSGDSSTIELQQHSFTNVVWWTQLDKFKIAARGTPRSSTYNQASRFSLTATYCGHYTGDLNGARTCPACVWKQSHMIRKLPTAPWVHFTARVLRICTKPLVWSSRLLVKDLLRSCYSWSARKHDFNRIKIFVPWIPSNWHCYSTYWVEGRSSLIKLNWNRTTCFK